jgi:endonuclease YncB( thermonuclease family)
MLLLASGSAYSGDLARQAVIIDGDTLEIHGPRVRLWGIDAPESNQLCGGDDSLHYRCGARAANELAAMVDRHLMICQPVSLDRYGRTVASCAVNGTDVAEWLVRQGLASDWARYSHGRYAKAESDARRHERGIRAGSYVQPWQFRDCVKRGGSPGRVFREIGVRNVATSKVDSKVKNICKGC